MSANIDLSNVFNESIDYAAYQDWLRSENENDSAPWINPSSAFHNSRL